MESEVFEAPATETAVLPVPHRAGCRQCPASVLFHGTVSGNGIVVLEQSGMELDTPIGIGDAGLPVCPMASRASMVCSASRRSSAQARTMAGVTTMPPTRAVRRAPVALLTLDKADPLPPRPACLGITHVAGDCIHGEPQTCTQCDAVLIAGDDEATYYATGTLVGTDCAGKPVEAQRYIKRGRKSAKAKQ